MEAPIGYSWHPETSEYVGTVSADPSPLEPGVWLWPARTTEVAPPQTDVGLAAVFDGEEWQVVVDARGGTWFTATGEEVKITALGDPSLVGLTPTYTAPPLTIEQQRAARLDDLAAKRWEVETGGIVVNGAPIRTDRETASILTAAFVTAMADPNYTVNWKAAPGVFVTLDQTAILAISAAVRGHIQACFDREAALSALIMAAEDGEAIASIDIEEGWP